MNSAFMVWNDAFTAGELDAFEQYGDRMVHQRAELALKGDINDEIRITRVAWREHNQQTAPLYQRIAQVVASSTMIFITST